MRNLRLAVFVLVALPVSLCARDIWHMQPVPVKTRWAKEVSPANALPDYPRPQMVRPGWQNLNGLWDYAITPAEAGPPQAFDGKILVPYPIESALSGVQKPLLPGQRLWYRTSFAAPRLRGGARLLLHFGAVDWKSSVFLNGKRLGSHQGGYQGFSFDITDALKPKDNELLVEVYDPTDTGPNPHGKQVLHPEGILYTATSGIWQTVWLETVPAVYISRLKFTPDIDQGVLRIAVQCGARGITPAAYTVEVTARAGKRVVGVVNGGLGDELQLPVPHARLWSPSDPFLYDLSVELRRAGKTVDRVTSYFGMRSVAVKKDALGVERIFLNGRPTYNLGVLDQGFWPEGIYTAPTDGALKFDIEAVRSMGFNTIRKHIKIEPERWYFWCDKLGVLVWQDMPNGPNNTPEAKAEFEAESAANIEQLYDHPSIVAWVLFNEGWGAYDQARLAQWMKGLDRSRLLNGHTGGGPGAWAGADMTDIHSYPGPEMPPAEDSKARVLGEFGGVGVPVPGHEWNSGAGWGYVKTSAAGLEEKYAAMAAKLREFERAGLSGSIYTQPYDVETELNGIMTYDRKVLKVPLVRLRKINGAFVPLTGTLAEPFADVEQIEMLNGRPHE